MKTIQVTIPDDLHQAMLEKAQRENISIEALIKRSLRATMALPMLGLTVEERAARANMEDFDRIMARVPNVPPDPGDERD
jgi:hypothetical protein